MNKQSANYCSNTRSRFLYANITISLVLKGWSAAVVLLMVPLTLNCLGAYQNGVWLTVSSLLVWIDQMDIGLGNGLRNRLATHVAHGEWLEARKIVSSTAAMLICLIFPILFVLLIFVWKVNIYSILNVIPEQIPELRLALFSAITLVCMTFVLKFIGNIYMGLQLPAISNLLIAIGQTLALIATWLLYINHHASFFCIVTVNTAAPLLAYLLAYPYTFYYRYPNLRPSLTFVNLHSSLELGSIGIKFFWLQIAAIIQFMTANILISQFFTPEMVTPYQIAYRYITLVMALFSVICMPFWNATTDAYERGDIAWIWEANRKMSLMSICIGFLLVLMVIISPWLYKVWIGNNCHVPYGMTILMAIYIYLLILSMRYSYFLNGIGALRLQLYMTIMTIIFIPLEWFVTQQTHSIFWFMIIMCLCTAPSIFVNMLQFHKILNGTAKDFWRI
ncbi:MAG: hypothetical protein J1E37_01945 [Prevotella sp.]|nr:hypothetical protein [Prevotella sp.]